MDIGSQDWDHLLKDGCNDLSLSVDASQIDRFTAYCRELVRWNRRINLTRIEAPRDIAIKHILDSLTPAQRIPFRANMLDLGSGAGFPGIPLKILRDDLAVSLIDASRKRIHFLKHIIRTFEFDGVSAYQMRAETLEGETFFDAPFDVVISRAFTSIVRLVRLSIPLLKSDGIVMAMKGPDCHAEMDEALRWIQRKRLPYSITCCSSVLPGSTYLRNLVVVSRYPGER
ncbi:MAG: 16S rRNA (guanine(527)-N(7))-methyltransferase RsmG [Desulfobacterales bacterium]